MFGYRPVAEIQTEEVDIVGPESIETMLAAPAVLAPLPRVGRVRMGQPSMHPVPDRRTRNPSASRDLAVVQSISGQAKSFSNGFPAMHGLPSMLLCGGGDSNPHVLADTSL